MNEENFEQLYWQLHPKLLRYALGLLDEAAANDAVAATFETLLRKRISVSDEIGERKAIALAFMVLRGHVSHEFRARKRRTSLGLRLARQPQPDDGRDLAEDVTTASEVRRWLALLSEADRHVIALFNAGYSTQEMAEILGCSVGAVARRRDRAKNRLRAVIERDAQEVYGDDPTFA